MLSINTIARVVVNTVRASASPASFNTGLILIKDSNYAAARRLKVFESASAAAAELTGMGFGASTEVYKAAVRYFSATPAPGRLLVSCHPASETLSQALDAVLDQTASFYGVLTVDTVTASDWLTFAQHVEGLSVPLMLFVPVTGTVADATASNGIPDKLHRAGIKRALTFYCAAASDCGSVMGTAMGLELSHKSSAFALCYKTVSGIQPSSLTQSEVDSLKALGCNVYVARGYTHMLLENGSVSNGQRYDEVLYVDKIAEDLQNAAVSLLADNPDKMPQTDDSTAQFIDKFSSILMGYNDMGVLASSMWRGSDIGPVTNGDVVENVLPVPSALDTDALRVELSTDYPFKTRFTYRVEARKDVALRIRIPSFAEGLTVDGEKVGKRPFLTFPFKAGETRTIEVAYAVRPVLRDSPCGMKMAEMGSLVFSVPIPYEKIPHEYERNGVARKHPYCDYEYRGLGDWNYAYCADTLAAEEREVGDTPFSSEKPPVVLKAKMRKIDWGLEDGFETVCAAYPESLDPVGGEEEVVLFPYGCAKLRMTQMPRI